MLCLVVLCRNSVLSLGPVFRLCLVRVSFVFRLCFIWFVFGLCFIWFVFGLCLARCGNACMHASAWINANVCIMCVSVHMNANVCISPYECKFEYQSI